MDKPVVDRLIEVANARGESPAQVALAWMLHKPVVTSPIIGATKPNQLDDAIKAVSIKLSNEEITRLEELYEPHPATEAFA
jgi:aryl-alcohol dehydrogenase-like predicted oxidoreductase